MPLSLGEAVGMTTPSPGTCVARLSRRREGTRCPAETAAPRTFQLMEGSRCLLHELACRLLIVSADALETLLKQTDET